MCIASLHLGALNWSAFCIEKLAEKFPGSKRIKRIYAMYREAVGEWDEAVGLYKDILGEVPENTFCRKRVIAIKRQQGRVSEACEGALSYLENFGTDKEVSICLYLVVARTYDNY